MENWLKLSLNYHQLPSLSVPLKMSSVQNEDSDQIAQMFCFLHTENFRPLVTHRAPQFCQEGECVYFFPLKKIFSISLRPKLKYFLFPLTRPTLLKWPDPKTFFHDLEMKNIFFSTKIYTFPLEDFSVLFCYFSIKIVKFLIKHCFEHCKRTSCGYEWYLSHILQFIFLLWGRKKKNSPTDWPFSFC